MNESKGLLLPLMVVVIVAVISSLAATTEVETLVTTESSPVITSSVPPSVYTESTTTEQQQTTTQQQIQSTETFLPVDYDVTLTTLTSTRDGAMEETETHPPSTERVKTTTATTTEEVMINDINIEQKFKNGLYRIKLAEITTNEFHSGAADVKKVPESGGKINIIDLYPSKVDDFVKDDDENKLSNAIQQQTDFTGKLLQERDGVITEIEKKFQLTDFMKPKRHIIPLNTRTEFIDRRVKKSYGAPQPPQTEFPLHIRNSNSSDAIRKIDFANTKFNTAKDDGNSKQPPLHPEFSTTKFYNSKELYNEMLHKKLSGAPTTMPTTTQSPLPIKYIRFNSKQMASTSTTKPIPTTIETPTVTTTTTVASSTSSSLPTSTLPSTTTTTRNKEMTTRTVITPKSTVATTTTSEKLAPTIAAVTKLATTEGDYLSTTTSSSPSSSLSSSTMVSPLPPTSSSAPPAASPSFQSLRPITRPRVLTRLEEKMNSLECEIQSVPQESHVWRGNETHELMLPIMVSGFIFLFSCAFVAGFVILFRALGVIFLGWLLLVVGSELQTCNMQVFVKHGFVRLYLVI